VSGCGRDAQGTQAARSGTSRLMHQAAQMRIDIAPPMPAFYNQPKTIDDIVNHTVGRLLDLFGLESGLVKRWGGIRSD